VRSRDRRRSGRHGGGGVESAACFAYPQSAADILRKFDELEAKVFETKIGKDAGGVRVAMWAGDAGYPSGDATVRGERHRLVMRPDGFVFENTVEVY
jgi:hypothetical protein